MYILESLEHRLQHTQLPSKGAIIKNKCIERRSYGVLETPNHCVLSYIIILEKKVGPHLHLRVTNIYLLGTTFTMIEVECDDVCAC